MTGRVLIVNADDFGRSEGVNEGVRRAFEEGIVTSASMMVRWPAAEAAASYARGTAMSVGLHFDISEWVHDERGWRRVYEIVDTSDAINVERQLQRQLDRFWELNGRAPTHLDSHQHVHRHEPAQSVLLDAGRALGIPVRDQCPDISYTGAFFGQDGRGYPMPHAITFEALNGIIRALPPGVTELGCHPGWAHDLDNAYRSEREAELAVLCDPRAREAIEEAGVVLASFTTYQDLAR